MMLLFKFIVTCLLLCTKAFNIDDESPIRLSPNIPRDDSYFGYTVALVQNSGDKWVIVGAPKADSVNNRSLVQPGEIFNCKLNLNDNNCSPIKVDKDTTGSDRNHGWLGVSLDVSPDNTNFVVCGHLVKNNYYPYGMCYTASTNFNGQITAKHTCLSKTESLGLSAHFSKNPNSALAGSSEYLLKVAPPSLENQECQTITPYRTRDIYRGLHTYYGYTLTSGYFFSKEKANFATGAPRENYIGKVYILDDNYYDHELTLSGEKMGEYFGAALCAIDLNNDGWDDLLVGAPFYTTNEFDEGKVYVYINNNKGNFKMQGNGILGTKLGARFGSSIAAVGDLNQDGYQDIAIGAPYEDNGRGAVYIYHGSSAGLIFKQQQKLIPNLSHTQSFGISISGSVDIDGNKYPDIAIGAFRSSEVFIYTTKPVINVTASLETNSSSIDVDIKDCEGKCCYMLSVCFVGSGKQVQISQKIRIRWNLTLDTLIHSDQAKRVVFQQSNTAILINEITDVQMYSRKICKPPITVLVKETLTDISPIEMQLKFEMSPLDNNNIFPILDQSTDTVMDTKVYFKQKCKDPTGKCKANLKVAASIMNFKNETPLIIGSTNKLRMNVKISNSADAAYGTSLTIHIPKWMTIDKVPPNCILGSKPLYCNIASKLESNSEEKLQLELNIQLMPINVTYIRINCTATSQIDELDSKDNTAMVNIQAKPSADIFVLGSTETEQILYNRSTLSNEPDASVNFTHSFQVHNAGPTTIDKVHLTIEYPVSINTDRLIEAAFSKIEAENGEGPMFIDCKPNKLFKSIKKMDAGKVKDLQSNHKITKRQAEVEERSTRETESRQSIALLLVNKSSAKDTFSGFKLVVKGWEMLVMIGTECNTGTVTCQKAECTVGPFKKDTSATIDVMLIASIPKIRKILGGRDSVMIVTEAKVNMSKDTLDIQPKDHKPDHIRITTEIKPGGIPLSLALAPWIIPVSIVGGLLLLALLILTMYKLGFFRRPQKEALQRQMHAVNETNETEMDNIEILKNAS